MIRRKTVIITGAGASSDYGYPLGSELRRHIINDEPLHVSLTQQFGKEAVSHLRERLLRSRVGTIDELLVADPSLDEVGRGAIARSLLYFEHANRVRLASDDPKSDWFAPLWRIMRQDARGAEEFGQNEVVFITYNYDRSLEELFVESLTGFYPKCTRTDAWTAIQPFKFLHLHGCLHDQASPIPPEYGRKPDEASVTAAAKGILLPYGVKPGCQLHEGAFRALRDAKRIGFLGFGYHQTLLSRLNWQRIWTDSSRPTILGTARFMHPRDLDAARNFVGRDSTLADSTCRDILDPILYS